MVLYMRMINLDLPPPALEVLAVKICCDDCGIIRVCGSGCGINDTEWVAYVAYSCGTAVAVCTTIWVYNQ